MAKMELAAFLAQCLTKSEFQAVVAASWIGAAYETFGYDHLTDMERDVVSSSLANQLLFGMRSLAGSGYRFRNFDTDGDGVPKPKDDIERCEGNVAYVLSLSSGLRFDYLKAVDALIDLVSGYNLNLDKRALKQARAEIVESLAAVEKEMSMEEAQAIVQAKRKRLTDGAKIADSLRVN